VGGLRHGSGVVDAASARLLRCGSAEGIGVPDSVADLQVGDTWLRVV